MADSLSKTELAISALPAANTDASPAITGAEALVKMLEAFQVRHVFGLCGDTSLPMYDAFARLKPKITHVLTRDERSAAYMADAYARVSGTVGVCEGPSGGGATYLLPGVVEANESSVPVLAITSDISTTSRGRYTLTELDQESLYRPLTKWNTAISQAADVPRLLRKAFTEMTTGRPGAVHLCLPFDVQKASLPAQEVWADASLSVYPAHATQASLTCLQKLADALMSASRTVIVCGGGVIISGGQSALKSVAQACGALIANSISGLGTIDPSDPLAVGVVGTNGGSAETRKIIQDADLIFFVGCRAGSVTTERRRAPLPSQRILHLDVDPAVIAANYETEAGAVGDARLSLEALLVLLDQAGSVAADIDGLSFKTFRQKKLRLRLAELAELKLQKHARFMALALQESTPIKPERLVYALKQTLPKDCIVVADPGTPCPYLSAYLDLEAPFVSGFYTPHSPHASQAPLSNTQLAGVPRRRFITNRAHGALGYAMSAAVGAWFASPQSKVVAVMGDGSFGFTCGELETIVRYDVPMTMIVVSNAVFGWIKAGQKSGFGERYFSVDFSRTDHAKVAEAFGVKSWTVDDPRKLIDICREALAYPGPTLIDVICQPLQEAEAPVSEWIA
jgi:acetolactate synthase I/II/III large subunit